MAVPRSEPTAAAGATFLARSLGDPDAFADFYTLYVARVSVYFVRRIFDPEVAVDLTAETFALALERRRQFRGRSAEEEQGWLFAIARSLLHGYWRKGRDRAGRGGAGSASSARASAPRTSSTCTARPAWTGCAGG